MGRDFHFNIRINMPLTSRNPIPKKSDNCYKITRKPPLPKMILADKARWTLPTAFATKQSFWKIRFAQETEEEWRHVCNYEMPDMSKKILQEIWDFWDGKRIFDEREAFYPTSKDTYMYTAWPRYIPHFSGMKIDGDGNQERVQISNILRWQVDGEREEREEEEEDVIVMKRKTIIRKGDGAPLPAKMLKCLCNAHHEDKH